MDYQQRVDDLQGHLAAQPTLAAALAAKYELVKPYLPDAKMLDTPTMTALGLGVLIGWITLTGVAAAHGVCPVPGVGASCVGVHGPSVPADKTLGLHPWAVQHGPGWPKGLPHNGRTCRTWHR